MKLGLLITARLKSSRLPLKLILQLDGKSVLQRVIERSKKVSFIDEVVVCTSTYNQDLPIAKIASQQNVMYFNGNPMDVLERLRDAARYFGLTHVLSITADNPLFSIHHADKIANAFISDPSLDFATVSNLPIGLGCYGLSLRALETVCEVKQHVDTEIWGPFLNRPEIFNVKVIENKKLLSNYVSRISLDEYEDYIFINRIFSSFPYKDCVDYFDLLALFSANEDILKSEPLYHQRILDQSLLDSIDNFFNDNRDHILKVKEKYS